MLSTSRRPCRSKFYHWESSWKQKAAKDQVLVPYYVFVTANPHFEGTRPLLPEVWETGNSSWQEFWCNSTDFISQLWFLMLGTLIFKLPELMDISELHNFFLLSHLTITNCSWFYIGVVKNSHSSLCKAQQIPLKSQKHGFQQYDK